MNDFDWLSYIQYSIHDTYTGSKYVLELFGEQLKDYQICISDSGPLRPREVDLIPNRTSGLPKLSDTSLCMCEDKLQGAYEFIKLVNGVREYWGI